ncbi:MAG TPA: hypothetical protein VND15_03215 [Candidatus Acidoferrales bacterium]|nr:hypothetical protein [Candidatus Acidoferrales bacterium]
MTTESYRPQPQRMGSLSLRTFDSKGVHKEEVSGSYVRTLTTAPYTTLTRIEPGKKTIISTTNLSVLMSEGAIEYGNNLSINGGTLIFKDVIGLSVKLNTGGILLQTSANTNGIELHGVKAIEKSAVQRYLEYTKSHLKMIVGERKEPIETQWTDGNWQFSAGEGGIRKKAIGNKLDMAEFSFDNLLMCKGSDKRDYHIHNKLTEIYVTFGGVSGMATENGGTNSLTEMRDSATVAVVHPGVPHEFLPHTYAHVFQVSEGSILGDKAVKSLDGAIKWKIQEFIRTHSQSG